MNNTRDDLMGHVNEAKRNLKKMKNLEGEKLTQKKVMSRSMFLFVYRGKIF